MHENRKLEVKQMLSVYLEREHSINTNRLFQCLNPEHNDSHPSMGFYDKGASPICHCFGCNATYDIFDVIELDYVSNNPRNKFITAYKIFNKYKKEGFI